MREQYITFFMQMQYLGSQDKITEKMSDISNILLNLKEVTKLKKKYIDVIKMIHRKVIMVIYRAGKK